VAAEGQCGFKSTTHTRHPDERRTSPCTVMHARARGCAVPGSGLQTDAAALDIGEDPVSIVLDLMHPCRASGGRGDVGAREFKGPLIAPRGSWLAAPPRFCRDCLARFSQDRRAEARRG
jgi:hypothetical protein